MKKEKERGVTRTDGPPGIFSIATLHRRILSKKRRRLTEKKKKRKENGKLALRHLGAMTADPNDATGRAAWGK